MRKLGIKSMTLFIVSSLALGAGVAGAGPGSGRGSSGSSGGRGRIVAVLPDGALREMCTAFTQVTESPFTPAEGTIEYSAEVSASSARLDSIRSRSVDVDDIGFTRGLQNRWAVSMTVDAWSGLGLTTGPVSGQTSPGGFGGGALALRHTFFGVDSSGVAMGLLATYTLPAAATSPLATSYGAALALPLSASLPLDFTLGAMAQVATLADALDSSHHLRFTDSLKLEREVAPHLSGWAEIVSVVDRQPRYPDLVTVNGGLSAELGKYVGLTVGAATGWADGTTDTGVFGGLALHR